MIEPETYFLPPTDHVPNSPLPVLVYRNVLPQPYTEESSRAFIEAHGWERKGPLWKAIYKRHYHPNVHECYAIISGSSEVWMGIGAADDDVPAAGQDRKANEPGLRFTLNAGDVVVHPAGTAHSNASEKDGYRYLSFFPTGSPHWVSEYGSHKIDLPALRSQTLAVAIPEDPVYGAGGHLPALWKEATDKYVVET